MSRNTVITIGREYGSGGREIGKKLAESLGIPFYDKELITLAAKESGMAEEFVEQADEKSDFWASFSMSINLYGDSPVPLVEMPINDRLFLIQSKVITELAKKGSCVIVGRAANYVLKEEGMDCLNVFLYASLENKIKRIMITENLTEKQAKDKIHKTDKKRASYYNYYTSEKWGRKESYDVAIDSCLLGIDGTVEVIKQIVQLKK